jgi:hypothetical protein
MSASRIPITILWCAFAAISADCSGGRNVAIRDVPHDLVVPPEAKDVKAVEIYGHVEVHYRLDENYPALVYLDTLDDTLFDQGWQRRLDDLLEPDAVGSHVRGWADYLVAHGAKSTPTNQWMAEWSNAAGEVAMYTLKYESTPIPSDATQWMTSPDNTRLEVVGIHYPAPIARLLAQQAGQIAVSNPAVLKRSPPDVATTDAKVLETILTNVNMAGHLDEVTLAPMTRPVCKTAMPTSGCFPSEKPSGPRALTRSLVVRSAETRPTPGHTSVPAASPLARKASRQGRGLLSCSLPGYFLGDALVVCAIVVEGKSRGDVVYALRRAGGGDAWEIVR